MNRATLLHSTPDLAVRRFDHPPHEVHHDPDHEVSEQWCVAFVQAGSFELDVGGKRHRMSPGSVLIERPGMAYQYRHGESCPDDVCLSIWFDPAAVSGAEHAWERAGWSARATATPRLAMVQQRLQQAVAAGNRFELERWGLATLSALQVDSRDARARGPYAPRAADVDAVIATCRAIEQDPTSNVSIAERARAVGLTGTVLTHVFRRYLGVSPHQYVIRWRVSTAASLLDEGYSVSESCYRAGFENLSHFCRTFHRLSGLRASGWTRLAPAERRRKVQALLRGHS